MDWFEVISENFMVEGGCPLQVLESFHTLNAPTLTDEAMRGDSCPAVARSNCGCILQSKSSAVNGCVSDVLSAVESGEKWREPLHQATTLIVLRRAMHFVTATSKTRRPLLLASLFKGASLAAICETVAAAVCESDQVSLIGRLLARWLGDGIIVPAEPMV